MPRYFFDVDDGMGITHDTSGIDLRSDDDIEAEAIGILRDLVHLRMPVGHRTLTVLVRDDQNAIVYRGKMTIDGDRF